MQFKLKKKPVKEYDENIIINNKLDSANAIMSKQRWR